jgi:hypothetical protein
MAKFHLQIGLQAIATYRRYDYEFWYALAEFVDNSTQSYANNREVLDKAFAAEGESLEVRIVHDRGNGIFRITDNSIGMSDDDLDKALEVARPPDNTSGRSKYGMGLKTSACWLGNKWSVKSKKIGDPIEYFVEVDVNNVALGVSGLTHRETAVDDVMAHYTVVEISDLNRPFRGRTVGKTKNYLRSMYRNDIKSGDMALYFNGGLLEWRGYEDLLLRNRAGESFKQDFDFEVNGKRIFGWAGVLANGKRQEAGFAILHAGRCVRAAPEAWRPERIMGIHRNDLMNQRLIGEINCDDFEVTQTKDNIQWFGDEQENVEKELQRHISAQVVEARRPAKDRNDERGPSAAAVGMAIEAVRKELLSPEMVDRLEMVDLPSVEIVRVQLDEIAEPVTSGQVPDIQAHIGNLEVWVYVANDMSPNDPYVVQQGGSSEKVIVIINMRHPYVARAGLQFERYMRECIYDAIAESKAQALRSKLDADTVKLIKDQLLRIPLQIDDHEATDYVEEDEYETDDDVDEEGVA